MRIVAVILILACIPLASAQTIYKCESGGKITYSGMPCQGNPVKQITPDAPATRVASVPLEPRSGGLTQGTRGSGDLVAMRAKCKQIRSSYNLSEASKQCKKGDATCMQWAATYRENLNERMRGQPDWKQNDCDDFAESANARKRALVVCNRNGSVSICSNGQTFTHKGDTTVGSNGTIYHHSGNTTVDSNGTSYNRIGDMVFGPAGKMCSASGDTVICN